MKRVAIATTLLMIASLAVAAPVAAQPANDTYAGRIAVALGFSAEVDTTEATTDADDAEANANCGAPATDASVWYEFTAASDGFVAVDVSESDYSAGVIVVTGSPGSFELVACGPEAIAFEAVTGETYAILAFDDQFDGGGNGGTLRIQIFEVPPPPEFTLTVDRTARFNPQTGSVTITGTATCTDGPAEGLFMDVFVRQKVGRIFIDGFGFVEGFACDEDGEPWSVEVFGFNGIFRGGKALSATFAVVCGEFLCTEGFIEQVIQLRGGKSS